MLFIFLYTLNQMKHHIFIIGLFIIYIILMTALMIWQGIGIAPDRYALVLLLATLLVKKTRSFLLDWVPFLFILISYDFLRGFVDELGQRVHFIELIEWEKAFFGSVLTQDLQSQFFNPIQLTWYDFVATIFYFLHFALPLAFAFLLWVNNRSYFRRFVLSISLLSYAAWITFMVYPSAPPWMAGQNGFLTDTTKILDYTLNLFPEKISLPTIYHKINPNPVAAMPSLHGGYPTLVLLYSIRFFGMKGILFLPYLILVWLSMVYLGEHYVIDLVSGAIYAAAFFFITEFILRRIYAKYRLFD